MEMKKSTGQIATLPLLFSGMLQVILKYYNISGASVQSQGSFIVPGKVWIFDEVTSALDVHTAQRLVTNLLEAGREKILLFVTHDTTLKERCAQVLTLERG